MKTVVLIPAAGLGTRMGGVRKPFIEIDGVPILTMTLQKFFASPLVSAAYVAVRPGDDLTIPGTFDKPVTVLEGGANRQESVAHCLARVPPDTDLVAIHDAVRPFVTTEAIERAIIAAADCGAAILGIPATDTLKRVERVSENALIRETIPREIMVHAQTPQVFRYDLLRRAFARARADGFLGTDEASLIEHLGEEVRVVMGDERNIKITRPSDLEWVRTPPSPLSPLPCRTGFGYDCHRLVEGRPLIVALTRVAFERGPEGHSDGDVVAHALTDALLGAAALGDIGRHFPNNDPRWKDADSRVFLEHTIKLLRDAGFRPVNVDACVILERPKLAPHIDTMRAALAAVLGLPLDAVSLKAKTGEGMGPVGEGRLIEAHAVATIARSNLRSAS